MTVVMEPVTRKRSREMTDHEAAHGRKVVTGHHWETSALNVSLRSKKSAAVQGSAWPKARWQSIMLMTGKQGSSWGGNLILIMRFLDTVGPASLSHPEAFGIRVRKKREDCASHKAVCIRKGRRQPLKAPYINPGPKNMF
eukprot:1015973-Pelagomonas_calceolata.AAC.3